MLGGSVPAYNTSTSSSGGHGFYVVADQAVARLGARSEARQVGVFGSLVAACAAAASPALKSAQAVSSSRSASPRSAALHAPM